VWGWSASYVSIITVAYVINQTIKGQNEVRQPFEYPAEFVMSFTEGKGWYPPTSICAYELRYRYFRFIGQHFQFSVGALNSRTIFGYMFQYCHLGLCVVCIFYGSYCWWCYNYSGFVPCDNYRDAPVTSSLFINVFNACLLNVLNKINHFYGVKSNTPTLC